MNNLVLAFQTTRPTRASKLRDFFFRSVDHLYGALIDPTRGERAVIATFVSYLLLWTLYAVIAKSSQDMHVDMAEQITWSRDLAFGFYKHPPLAAIVVHFWFSIFPIADWSYYLLSVSVATLALWIAWRLSADYLPAEKRVAGLALLTFIPFFNFLALNFNVNTILVPLWAATTLWFLRSFRTKSIGYAVLAGVGAAACLYAKYWSLFLLFGLAVAALMNPERGNFFRSWAPWVTIVVCLIILVPHSEWLIEHDFVPLTYALATHHDKAFDVTGVLKYLVDCLLYVAFPVTLAICLAWPLPRLSKMLRPRDSGRRLVTLSFWTTLLSPAGAAFIAGFKVVGLWSMSMWTLLPVMLLSPGWVTVTRAKARNILALAIAVPTVSVLVSPAIAIIIHRTRSVEPHALHGQLLAKHVDAAWAVATPTPLRFVDGDEDLAYEVAAYAHDRPHALLGMPVVKPEKVAQDGKVIACYADTGCARNAFSEKSSEPASRLIEITITRNYFGAHGTPQNYVILVVPPKPLRH